MTSNENLPESELDFPLTNIKYTFLRYKTAYLLPVNVKT
jgi:hypothetical protein